jgi:RNA polymerase sigma-70 factor (ECF subfamily)
VNAPGDELIHGTLAGGDVRPAASIDHAEEELARLLKARSVAAWETLFERQFDRIYRYALGRLFCQEAAEDVAAATFDRALATIDSYSYRGRPALAWLYGIARNVVNETRRSEKRQGATELLKSLLHRENGHGATNGLLLMQADNSDALVSRVDLEHALRGLTEIQREVVLLRYFAGLTATETGQVIGRPETAVYALQARALAALRRQLT